MGFKKENYTLKGLCARVCLLMMITCNHAFAQTAPHCPIRVEFEPRIEQASSAANDTRQNLFPFFTSWQDIDNLRLSDDNYMSVSLDGYRRSTMVFGDKLGYNIPPGAEITGLEIIIEGHTRGEGFGEGLLVQLLNNQGLREGDNKAGDALPIDADWPTTIDSTDNVWRYGGANDNWGIDLDQFLINNPKLGYALQVRNKLPQPLDVLIDNIQIVIHYIPLYAICSDHACVPFYIDESDDPQLTYEWYIPQGWELISDSENDAAINIGPSYATLGEYEICVESFLANDSQGICCRKFNYEDCNPGMITGQVFLDQNGDFAFDDGDVLQSGVQVNLFNLDNSISASTTTNEDGVYLFPEVFQGDYFIQVIAEDGLTYVIPNIGSEEDDSDITNAFGAGTTELISIEPNEQITNIDAGLSRSLTIGDFVWEDLNGNGTQQDNEPGIAGVTINLANNLANTISTITDANGFYSFVNIPSSEYNISTENIPGFVPTKLNNGDAENNSNFSESPLSLSYLDGGNIDSIDAGFLVLSSIGDFVWEDLNKNGIQDQGEPGISAVKMYLHAEDGTITDSTLTDENGNYEFTDIYPGDYVVSAEASQFFTSTTANAGSDPSLDSDGILVDGDVQTNTITIISGSNLTDIDFGFFILPVDISGFTWIDENNDGQFQPAESFIGNILVSLFDIDDNLIADTLSDAGGFFSFEEQLAGSYYLRYELPTGFIFTTANIGDDLSDSDVDGSNGDRTTPTFSLLPGQSSIDNAAGYQALPSVQGVTWIDANGNGRRDIDDLRLSGITVNLRAANGDLIETNITNEEGVYQFENIPVGEYYVEFIKSEDLQFTIFIEDEMLNSDVNEIIGTGTTSAFTLIGNQNLEDIDAGFFSFGSIGDFVWQDLNNNGIQDSGEPGLSGILLTLIDNQGATVATIETSDDGEYTFTDLTPGTYTIELSQNGSFAPTLPNQGDPELDSDAIIADGTIAPSSIIISSGDEITNIDFGFIELPATVGGFTWIDADNDGQFQIDESLLSDVTVSLFLADGTLIGETTTDEGGFYSFVDVAAGDVYLQFERLDAFMYTLANQGNDLSDSDVTSENGMGTTEIFSLLPADENFTYSAGYQLLPKVGDFVWLDENGNGIQDSDEIGINGVTVNLHAINGTILKTTITGINPNDGTDGYYLFDTLSLGQYYISFEPVDTLNYAPQVDTDLTLNSDITEENGIGSTAIFLLLGNDCNLDIDGGYALKNSNISGEVWVDSDVDGIQNIDDPLIGGIIVRLFSDADIEISSTETDTLGQYSFVGLDAGAYYVVFDTTSRYTPTLPLQGTDTALDSDLDDSEAIGSTGIITLVNGINQENIDAGLVDGAISLNGFTWIDDNNNGTKESTELPLPGVEVKLYAVDGTLLDSMIVDEDGNYSFSTVLEGEYYLVFDNQDESFINVEANQGDDSIDDDVTNAITSGSTDTISVIYFDEIPPISAGYYQLATIGDMAFIDVNENNINDLEPGLDDVVVNLITLDGTIVQSAITAQGGGFDSGYYLIEGIIPGAYQLQFIRPLSYQFITGDFGVDDEIDSDVNITEANTGTTDTLLITSGSTNTSLDAGFVFRTLMESSIAGSVWDDDNANGLFDIGEELREETLVSLLDNTGTPIASQLTDANGAYIFDMLTEGFYNVSLDLDSDEISTVPNVGMDDEIDSDFFFNDPSAETGLFFVANSEDVENVDLGIVDRVRIGNFVWEDLNNNGTQEANEPGIPGVSVTVTDSSNSISKTTVTDENGNYEISDIPAGTYQVCIAIPDGFFVGKKDAGIDQLDSDANEDGCTDIFTILTGINNDIDFALTRGSSISGIAFSDLNGNGIKNILDEGINDITIYLYSGTGELLDSTITTTQNDTLGRYSFTNLRADDYYLVFNFPPPYILSDGNSAPDDIDSDITSLFERGSTDIISLGADEDLINVDGGAYFPACIGDRVWEDLNKNGLQDDGEPGIGGIEVIIFRSFGVPFDTVFTNSEGIYKFTELRQGLYFIQFMIPQTFTITLTDQGVNDDIDNDADETGTTPLISLASGAELTSVDCGIFQSMASLRSVVWEDLNGDGVRQSNEARIPDIRLTLYDEADVAVASTISNSLGLYAFQEIPEGNYKVFVDLENTDYAFTSMDMAGNDLFDSDIHENGESDLFTSAEVLSIPNVDVGLLEMGSINGTAWFDEDQNGIFDLDEVVLSDIKVQLYNDQDELINELITSTEEEENIKFTNLRPGRYHLEYKVNKTLRATTEMGLTALDNNSDLILQGGKYRSPEFTVESKNIVTHVDAGFIANNNNEFFTEKIDAIDIEESTADEKTIVEPIEQISHSEVEDTELKISMHPNPATNYIKIEIPHKENATVKIVNANKEVVLSASASQMERINLQHLHPGIYYVTLEQNGKSVTRKLIKIH